MGPCIALAFAMSVHMLAAFAGVSVVVLLARAIQRRQFMYALTGVGAAAAVVVGTMLALDMPMSALYQGSWGTQAVRRLVGATVGGSTLGENVDLSFNWAFYPFDRYHWDQYNLLALMLPGHLVLVPLVLWRRIQFDAVNLHLLAATAGMMLFHFTYRAMLPIDHDWNLFAGASVPLAILIWRNLLNAEGLAGRVPLALGWAGLSAAHTLAWVLANHRYVP